MIGIGGLSAAVASPLTLVLNPTNIQSDYVGDLTLSIGNLNTGMTVRGEVFVDLNTNGIIDAGDFLLKSFEVNDGRVPLVAGVRNFNVAGDEDGLTNGQIRTVLHFPPTSGGSLVSGRALVRVSDPAGSLTSVTQAFTITQKILPQSVTGRITLAGSGLPHTNSAISLQGLVSTTPSLASTDANGNYHIYCLPGIYGILGVNNNGAIYNETVLVSVPCGQTVTNNLTLSTGTFNIAGRVTDSSTGLGIPALELDADTTNNLDVATFTDTNGNYVVRVTPNTWSLHPSPTGAAEAGYVSLSRTNVTVTSASVSNVNFVLSPPTAMISGTIKDALNNPVVGVEVSASSANLRSGARSFATNGTYGLGVLAGTWNPAPNVDDLGIRGFIGPGTSVTVASSQATNVNFVVTRTNWPVLSAPLHGGSGEFQFTLSGLAGQVYAIQRSTNVTLSNWVMALVTNAPCNTLLVQDPQATNNKAFYRAVILP
jgi:hypothetical protein